MKLWSLFRSKAARPADVQPVAPPAPGARDADVWSETAREDAVPPADRASPARAASDATHMASRARKDLLTAAWQPGLAGEERRSLFASAEHGFKVALDLDGNCMVALIGLGQVLAKRDSEYLRAVQFYDRAIAIEPGNAEAFMLKAASMGDMGRWADALACIETAIAGTRDAEPLQALTHVQCDLLARVPIEVLARDRHRSSGSISLRVTNVVQFKQWLLGHGFQILGPEEGFAVRPMLVWINDNMGCSIGEWTESRDGAVNIERVIKLGAGASTRELGWAQLCQRLNVDLP